MVGAAYAPPGAPPAGAPLQPPDGFSRPPNLAQSYTWFELMKIQDMEDFYDTLPRMPLVLVPHDVYHDDWIRFMQDLALAWAGKLPSAGAAPAKGSALAVELIELWNQAFFHQRGVDVVLFRGRERRTGRRAGAVDASLPGLGGSDEDSDGSSSSLSSDSDVSDNDRFRSGPYYGRPGENAYSEEMRDAKRRAREKKAEKRRKHKEKKARRKAKERERRYALYISCITQYDQ